MSAYHCDWKDDGREGMIRDFGIAEADLDGVEVLYAAYTYEDYSGSAFVLFKKDGNLFEVNGGHCSCYGLDGQWKPEETSLAALDMRQFGDLPEGEKAVILAAV